MSALKNKRRVKGEEYSFPELSGTKPCGEAATGRSRSAGGSLGRSHKAVCRAIAAGTGEGRLVRRLASATKSGLTSSRSASGQAGRGVSRAGAAGQVASRYLLFGLVGSISACRAARPGKVGATVIAKIS